MHLDLRSHLNCLSYCMHRVLSLHGRSDILEVLVQPLGFGFEVELGSRDWWLGGYADNTFHRPEFNRGVQVWWEDKAPDDFFSCIGEEFQRGQRVLLQTEWTFVPYTATLALGNVHTVIVLNHDGDRLLLFDRLGPTKAPELFGPDMCAWVDVQLFREAFTHRLQILRYRFHEPVLPWPVELLHILERSVTSMLDRKRDQGPLLHLVEGLDGIHYFAQTLKLYRSSFRLDQHTLVLLGVRLPDTITYIVGNRLLLRKALLGLPDSGIAEQFRSVVSALEQAVATWKQLASVLKQTIRKRTDNFDEAVAQVYRCADAEKLLVEVIQIMTQKGIYI